MISTNEEWFRECDNGVLDIENRLSLRLRNTNDTFIPTNILRQCDSNETKFEDSSRTLQDNEIWVAWQYITWIWDKTKIQSGRNVSRDGRDLIHKCYHLRQWHVMAKLWVLIPAKSVATGFKRVSWLALNFPSTKNLTDGRHQNLVHLQRDVVHDRTILGWGGSVYEERNNLDV